VGFSPAATFATLGVRGTEHIGPDLGDDGFGAAAATLAEAQATAQRDERRVEADGVVVGVLAAETGQ
jgi:hypothetical protein